MQCLCSKYLPKGDPKSNDVEQGFLLSQSNGRIDYQPLFGKMSPRNADRTRGAREGRKSSLIERSISSLCLKFHFLLMRAFGGLLDGSAYAPLLHTAGFSSIRRALKKSHNSVPLQTLKPRLPLLQSTSEKNRSSRSVVVNQLLLSAVRLLSFGEDLESHLSLPG